VLWSVEAVAALAERQQGAVSLSQLLKAGVSDREIRAWLRTERLGRTAARTVFRMPGAEPNWRQALWVAVLAGPPGTVASHASAAALRGLLPPPEKPNVTVPRQSSGRFGGAIVHHARVTAADSCRVEGIPATGVARAIVDCAPLLGQPALNQLVDAAFGRGLCTYRRVRAAWDRAGRVRGGDLLAGALAPYTGNVELGSEKEAHVLRRIHQWGLPAPVCQYEIRDRNGRFVARVDFGWPAWRFGLEYDGDAAHSPRQWTHDDRRVQRIEALGWRIERADRGDLRPSSTRLRDLLVIALSQAAA
jgi:hypothetical protein